MNGEAIGSADAFQDPQKAIESEDGDNMAAQRAAPIFVLKFGWFPGASAARSTGKPWSRPAHPQRRRLKVLKNFTSSLPFDHSFHPGRDTCREKLQVLYPIYKLGAQRASIRTGNHFSTFFHSCKPGRQRLVFTTTLNYPDVLTMLTTLEEKRC